MDDVYKILMKNCLISLPFCQKFRLYGNFMLMCIAFDWSIAFQLCNGFPCSNICLIWKQGTWMLRQISNMAYRCNKKKYLSLSKMGNENPFLRVNRWRIDFYKKIFGILIAIQRLQNNIQWNDSFPKNSKKDFWELFLSEPNWKAMWVVELCVLVQGTKLSHNLSPACRSRVSGELSGKIDDTAWR